MLVRGSLVPVLMLMGIVVVVAIVNLSIDVARDCGFGLAFRRTTRGGG